MSFDFTVYGKYGKNHAIMHHRIRHHQYLRFDKEDNFQVLVFYRLFYKINRQHFFRVPIRYRNIRESLRELEIAWKHSPCMRWDRVPTSISCSPKFPLVFL